MPYPEMMIRPMREDLTRLGVEELRTPEAVDETVTNSKGTLMVVVNSICGCAAGRARPGVALALQNEVKPDKVARCLQVLISRRLNARAAISQATDRHHLRLRF